VCTAEKNRKGVHGCSPVSHPHQTKAALFRPRLFYSLSFSLRTFFGGNEGVTEREMCGRARDETKKQKANEEKIREQHVPSWFVAFFFFFVFVPFCFVFLFGSTASR